MSDAALLIAPVGLPLFGAAVAVLLRRRPHWSEAWAALVLLATALASVAMFGRSTASGPATVVFGGWPQGIGVGFASRMPGAALVLVVLLVAVAAAVYGRADIGEARRRAGYDALMLALVGAVDGALLTTDLFNLYVWFELALVAALGLITLDRKPAQIGGALRYAIFGMAATTAVLAGIGLLYGATGTLDLGTLATVLATRPPTLAVAAAGGLMLGGFALKSGLAPFHVWLPVAYASTPPTVAAIFGALLTKMGFYAMLLLFGGVLGKAAAPLLPALAWIAAATMVGCAFTALAQNDLRRLVAYHVVAQVGYMAAGLSLGTPEGKGGATFYMVHSMIVQANLFLAAGAVHRATGTWDLKRAGGMMRSHPLFALLFAVPLLSLGGIPPFSGFWAKFLVLRATLDAGRGWLAAAELLAALVTLASVAALWAEVCWKEPVDEASPCPLPFAFLGGMALLSLATVLIGTMPETLFEVARTSAKALTAAGARP